MQNKKIQYIEWLRIISSFAVVGIHITMTQPNNYSVAEIGSVNYMILTSIYALVQWAVPVFLMITGNLLLHSRTLTIKKVKKMISRMILVLLIYGSVFALLEQIVDEKTFRLIMLPKSILLTMEQNSWSHLWYLYVLIGIYIISIPLKKFVDNASNKEVCCLTGVLLIGNFVVPTINFIFELKIYTFMVFSQYVTYILLGYIIDGLSEKETNECYHEKIKSLINCGWWWLGLFCLASVIKILIQCISVLNLGEGAVVFLSDRLFTLIQALAVYCLFKKYMVGKTVRTLAKSISRCSFGIYLIHPFFINLLYKMLGITPTNFPVGGVWLGIIFLWSFVFVISWCATWIMIKIPLIRQLL